MPVWLLRIFSRRGLSIIELGILADCDKAAREPSPRWPCSPGECVPGVAHVDSTGGRSNRPTVTYLAAGLGVKRRDIDKHLYFLAVTQLVRPFLRPERSLATGNFRLLLRSR